jgi:hypothetical protein
MTRRPLNATSLDRDATDGEPVAAYPFDAYTNPQAVIPGGGPQQSSVPKGAAGSYPHRLAMPYRARATHAPHRARSGLGHTVGVAIARVADTLSAPRFILFYLGFYAGCMATVGLAVLWSKVLS